MSKPVTTDRTAVDSTEKEPTRLMRWASLLIGLGLALAGTGRFLAGDYEQAGIDFTGAFGTMGLPALSRRGYHVEIKRDRVLDTSPPPGFEGVGRLTDTNEDIDAEPLPGPRARPRPGPSAEVRRGDEL